RSDASHFRCVGVGVESTGSGNWLISVAAHDGFVATRESNQDRGRRRGRQIAAAAVGQLRDARVSAGVSPVVLARGLGWSQQNYSRFELRELDDLSMIDLCVAAAM